MNRFITLIDDLSQLKKQPSLAVATQTTQQQRLDSARAEARMRVQRVYLRLNGTHPMHGQQWRQDGLRKARTLIDSSISNIDDVVDVIDRMHTVLSSARRFTTQHDPAHCGMRGAYYDSRDRLVHTCPAFFSLTSEEQIRTMIHEAAHAAGIGESGGNESYLVIYDCTTSFNNKNVADGWAHFVHCVLDLPTDPPNTVRANPAVSNGASAQSLVRAQQANCPQMAEARVANDEFVLDILQFFFDQRLSHTELNDDLRDIAAQMLWAATQASRHMDVIPRPPQGVPSVAWLVSEAVQIAFRRAHNRCIYDTVKGTVARNFSSAYEIAKAIRSSGSYAHAANAGAAIAAAGLGWQVFQGIAQNKGDITWITQRMEGAKHPWEKKEKYENIASWKQKKLTLKQSITTAVGLDEVSATFNLNFRYNGHSVGFVSLDNIGTNDAPFWGMQIDITIMPDPNAYQINNIQPVAAVEVTSNFRFTHSIRDDVIYLHKMTLYGTGHYEQSGNWTQS